MGSALWSYVGISLVLGSPLRSSVGDIGTIRTYIPIYNLCIVLILLYLGCGTVGAEA